MDLMLSEMEYLLLIQSLNTKYIPTITESILRIEKMLWHLQQVLSPVQHPLHSTDINGMQYCTDSMEAIDLSMKKKVNPCTHKFSDSPLISDGKELEQNFTSPSASFHKSKNESRLYPASYPVSRSISTPALNVEEKLAPTPRNKRSASTPGALKSTRNASGEERVTERRVRRANNSTRSIFPSKRPITCNICDKVIRADNFQVHLRSHTGEKPYKCPKCTFRSANPSSMPKHLRLHDKEREIYRCDQCSYSTIYKSNLSAHKKTHRLSYHSPEQQPDTNFEVYQVIQQAQSLLEKTDSQMAVSADKEGNESGLDLTSMRQEVKSISLNPNSVAKHSPSS